MNSVLLTIVATALTGPLVQDGAAAPEATHQQGLGVNRCIVALIDDIPVPAREAGLLNALHVKDGDEVQAGQSLAKLDSTDAESAVKVAQFEQTIAQRQSESTVEVEAALKAYEVALAELEESIAINKLAPGTVAKTQVRREELTMQRADYQHQAAMVQHEVAKDTLGLRGAELEVALNRLAKHEIRSPLDGEVAQIIRRPGTWVQPGDPVIRIVRMNRLRIEGLVESDKASPAQVQGQPVTITVDCGRDGERTFKGVIDFVSPIVEASGKYRVWAEVANEKQHGQWVMRPGFEARMDIALKSLSDEDVDAGSNTDNNDN